MQLHNRAMSGVHRQLGAVLELAIMETEFGLVSIDETFASIKHNVLEMDIGRLNLKEDMSPQPWLDRCPCFSGQNTGLRDR
jgi:hypothetical protein